MRASSVGARGRDRPRLRSAEYAGDVTPLERSHPWSGSSTDPSAQYLDLRATPSLIRTSLEDFVPWSDAPAVQRFYALLEWVNGGSVELESNDCSFSPPARDAHATSSSQAFECSGRLMILFRALGRNVPGDVEWPRFTRSLHEALSSHDRSFELGLIGTTLVPVRYRALASAAGAGEGTQLMVSFWAWGRTEDRCLISLSRVIENLSVALREVASSPSA